MYSWLVNRWSQLDNFVILATVSFVSTGSVEVLWYSMLHPSQDRDNQFNIIRMIEYFYFRNHLCITFELMGWDYLLLWNILVCVTSMRCSCVNSLHCPSQSCSGLAPQNMRILFAVSDSILVWSSCLVSHAAWTFMSWSRRTTSRDLVFL